MPKAILCDLIHTSPLAVDLNDEDCAVLSDLAESRTYKDGETLFNEGDCDDTLYLISSGKVSVNRITGTGDVTLAVLNAGDMAGEMSFIDGAPHSATVRAVGETVIVMIHRDAFEKLIDTHPKVVYHVMRAIMRVVHEILRRMNTQHVELTNYITQRHGRY